MKKKNYIIILIIAIIFISGISGCVENYNFITSLNVSCNIPNSLVDKINSQNWKSQDMSLIYGNLCEAITEECSAEVEIFRSDSNYLRHRIHYYGASDNTYYLTYNSQKYKCIKNKSGERDYISSKNITKCLDNPSSPWQKIDSQVIIARFDNKSDDFISDLANKFEIVNLKMGYKSDDIIFVEFNIKDNLPIEKICGFLNSKNISYHYPKEQARIL